MLVNEVEKPLIEISLNHCGHNKTKVAKITGLIRSTLRNKIECYNLT